MHDLLDQIDSASAAHLYYVALCSALAVPDIAGALQSPNGLATGQNYADWFDTNVGSRYVSRGSQTLTGQDCYYFRCSMLHQGTAQLQNSKAGISRILFLEPGKGLIFHNNTFTTGGVTVLNIDVGIFCADITACARVWLSSAQPTPLFQQNFAKCVARHPQGIAPYIVGSPVIG